MTESIQMTQEAIAIRSHMLRQWGYEVGRETIKEWANDPVKVRIINVMAQMTADDRAVA